MIAFTSDSWVGLAAVIAWVVLMLIFAEYEQRRINRKRDNIRRVARLERERQAAREEWGL